MPSEYPVSLAVQRPDSQSRLTNFPLFIGTFIRSILLIPHFIILYLFGLLAAVVYFIATFAILFTGRYPEGLYNLIVAYTRWIAHMYGYLLHLNDKYPPFSGDASPGYPLQFSTVYPGTASRLLNFPLFIGMFIRVILLIPHIIVIYFLFLVAFIIVFIAQFAILFTGSFPAGMHGFVAGTLRWNTRISAYLYGLTDKYPPFSMS
jgi:hypothetical protein